MDKELNENELENVLGGANPKAVEEKLQDGYTKTFRDKVLESKFGGRTVEDIRQEKEYVKTFRDKVLEAGLARTREEDERNRTR